jgi:hypothetical protein
VSAHLSLREFTTLDEDTVVAEAAKVMRDKDTSYIWLLARIPKNQLVLSQRDVLYHVLAKNLGSYKVTLKKISLLIIRAYL